MPNLDQTSVTVTTTAAKIADGRARRMLITFCNTGSTVIYLGGPGVTSSAFIYPLQAGEWIQWEPSDADPATAGEWYGVTASGTCTLSIGYSIA